MDDYMTFITFFILFYICSCCCCSKTRISSSRYIRELSNHSFHSSNSDATETCTDISSNNDNV